MASLNNTATFEHPVSCELQMNLQLNNLRSDYRKALFKTSLSE
jgi:hypothetical protein